MAKVLLVDTNFSSGPIYQALLRGGHEVHVVGGNPHDCLAKAASSYWQLDYSDTAALAALIDTQGFDFIVPGCTDRSYVSCVMAGRGQFPGIDSPHAAEVINHKARFRQMAEHLGLPVPRVFTDADAAQGSPLIVKPVDAFSGKGISVIREYSDRAAAIAVEHARSISPSGECLLEEYVEGQLYSHSAFITGQRVIEDFLVREDGSANPFVVDTSHVLHDAPLLRQILRQCIETLSSGLGLVDGLVHTQFIATKDGIRLIEVTRRCPGDLYSQLIELSTGFRYAEAYAQPFLGQPVSTRAIGQSRPVLRHTITVPTAQNLTHVSFRRPLAIERWVPLGLVGDRLQASPACRIAVIFCTEPDPEALDDLYQCTLRRELYTVVDGYPGQA
ncbi:ATP-grasp domain-containing protein [Stenotrophomonas sp. Marseille-Q4652]|uniref:ATP-grasp domain-containing protein n=1 Tax=Stenotrophomonas sp. Marseille-Q4652 TaxID=2866595 RepID=UPI001CE420D3|nr:ATP-grasp domain-containing protein [Stenotrophomonas sp. Marseille-Q4652]